jgi:hypothetical protein
MASIRDFCKRKILLCMREKLLAIMATAVLISPVALVQPVVAQTLVNVSPAVSGTNIAPDASISGQFDTTQGAVQLNSVKILVNGTDVTRQSTITPNLFTYRPSTPFSPGTVTVRVEYLGQDGTGRFSEWNFTVQQPQSSALSISSVSHNAATALGANTTFLATITGTPGAQASVLLIENGQTVRSISAQEVSSGVYVATLAIPQNTRVTEGILVGRIQRQTQTVYEVAAQPVLINSSSTAQAPAPSTGTTTPSTGTTTPSTGTTTPSTGTTRPLAPQFTSHTNGSEISGTQITLAGETRPGATVRLRVTYRTSVLGLIGVGDTLYDQDVTADSNGVFQATIPLATLNNSGTRYTVTAVATLNGETSSTTTLSLSHN